jgi:hypothetical protein
LFGHVASLKNDCRNAGLLKASGEPARLSNLRKVDKGLMLISILEMTADLSGRRRFWIVCEPTRDQTVDAMPT